jgi:hypothetical protein
MRSASRMPATLGCVSWPLLAVILKYPDQPGHSAAFGYPGSRTGPAGYPQAQGAVLVEGAIHTIVAANLGAYRPREWAIGKPLLASLTAGMLCRADRGFNGVYARASGQRYGRAFTVARRKPSAITGHDTPVGWLLPQHDLSSGTASPKHRRLSTAGIPVSVIEYTLPQPCRGTATLSFADHAAG